MTYRLCTKCFSMTDIAQRVVHQRKCGEEGETVYTQPTLCWRCQVRKDVEGMRRMFIAIHGEDPVSAARIVNSKAIS